LYDTASPPKISLTARLVSTGEQPRILWIDGVGLAGDDSRGILGLGLIEDPKLLQEKALKKITGSLGKFLAGQAGPMNDGRERRFDPKIVYHSPRLHLDRKGALAVLPFLNDSAMRNAGEIIALDFVRQLARNSSFDIIEPGVVRQKLLNFRIIMPEGPSLQDIDALFETLGVDLILTGQVLDYENHEGPWARPRADFFVSVFERKSRKVVWSSRSSNAGDDRVFFFDYGLISTAEVLVSKMVRSIAWSMGGKPGRPLKDNDEPQNAREHDDQGEKNNYFNNLLFRASTSPW
ncbi:MAG TPA: hypothetical protein VF903_09880, partial [Nitrospirota bacterium]